MSEINKSEEHIHLDAMQDKVTILHGQADQRFKKQFKVKGSMSTPFEFMYKNAKWFQDGIKALEVDTVNLTIKLRLNIGLDIESEVIGSLEAMEEFKAFKINEGFHSRDDIKNLCRTMPHVFEADMATNLYKSLIKFHAKFSTERKEDDDRRGNTEFMIKTVAKDTNLPETLKFDMPVYKNVDPLEIIADVELEPTGSDVKVLFYSQSLILDVRRLVKAEIKKHVEDRSPQWDKWGIPVIYKS